MELEGARRKKSGEMTSNNNENREISTALAATRCRWISGWDGVEGGKDPLVINEMH